MDKQHIIVIIAVVVVAAAITVVAFSGSPGSTQSTDEPPTKVVVDMAGREVAVPVTVDSVVSFDPFSSQIIFALEAEDMAKGGVVGPADREVLSRVCPGMLDLHSLGDKQAVNKEELLALDPDAVISAVTYTQTNKEVEGLGVPLIEIDFETPEGFLQTVETIGAAIGKEENADAYAGYYTSSIDRLDAMTAGIPAEERKTIYFAGRYFLNTAGEGFYQNYLIEHAGGVNVAASSIEGGWKQVSAEQILQWNPEIIILAPYCQDLEEEIASNVQYQDIAAVKTGAVYRMPKFIMAWDMPVPETILGTLWLADTLYPEESDIDMPAEMRGFYRTFYGYEISDDEIGQALADTSVLGLDH
jgi:iron complex transport system substrate-binding protein